MWNIELLTSPGHTYAAQKGLKAGNNNLGQHKWERFPLQQATNGATAPPPKKIKKIIMNGFKYFQEIRWQCHPDKVLSSAVAMF